MLALKSALADKLINNSFVVFDSLELPSLKTKELKNLIQTTNLEGKVLFVTAEDCENLYMATRNLGYAYAIMANEINCYDLINADMVVCDEEAIKVIEGGLK